MAWRSCDRRGAAVSSLAIVWAVLTLGASAQAQPCGTGLWQLAAATGGGPTARAKHAMVFDPVHGQTILFGGIDGALRGETWAWDGAAWSQLPVAGPTARQAPGFAFDTVRGRAVLFGGNDGSPRGDTWEWTGSTWVLRSAGGVGSPSGRYLHAVAYDAVRGRTVLFGGYDGALRGDTWEWDGATWTPRSTGGAGSPTARYMHAMAFDPARTRTVMFGGYDGTLRGDTWEWDGAAWSLRAASGGPTPRSGAAMTYDPARQRIVLFAGHDGAYRNDIWEWNGVAWAVRQPGGPSAPSGRTWSGIVYDSVHQLEIAFGGIVGGVAPNYVYAGDTWTSSGEGGPAIVQQPAPLAVNAGQQATFTVQISGGGAATYQWRHGGAALVGGERSVGTTTPTLTIDPVMMGVDAGEYDVVVTTPCGTTTSSPAMLTVLCRPDWNGDAHLGPEDVSGFVAAWFNSVRTGAPGGDFDRNLIIEPADVSAFVAAWMAGLGGSCPP